ncbi:MAG: ATP-dependent helicase RhlE [Pseudomonadota bacterium]|nr:ATP-dependent helicase RhlE [Pseudomonadota bacterium]MDQ5881376.1 ATP-dependent helicase RhlE [Pseudomonadota bacterium]MDQ5902775.1 ATP-dependent helicase RhlE [Pseudomonadota bacterium]MDQ5915380.1 ATP-dependent helicase RhlE [Pseudomonadota bacterium]MDQ5945430.1 ATP-dependent helicase RhlE [Pseudomonadota bacterium]
MKFTELGLSAEIQRAVAAQGYDTPTPIQAQAIPVVLAGRDLMACAQTGTGKTAGFTLPILQLLSGGRAKPKRPRVLVLTPTRELAMQVEESVRTYGKHLPLTSLCVFGGVGINPQIQGLARGVDILVATPGRLLDHMQQRTVDLSDIKILVLDEADRMLDMGFIRDIRKILAVMPKQRQSLLFSATFSDEIRELAHTFLNDPASVEVARRNTTVETVAQRVIYVDREKKSELLIHLLQSHGWHQVLVFARTKHGSDALARKIEKAGISSAALHGNKSQGARVRALNDFKDGKLVVLVATDIAARGLDIDALPHVINFELPNIPEDYVHRIGRTGRAGMEGEALSLVCADERLYLRDIEKLIKREIDKETLPGFEPIHTAAVSPPPQRRGGNPQRQGQPGNGGNRGGRGGGAKPQGTAAAAKPGHRSGQRHH